MIFHVVQWFFSFHVKSTWRTISSNYNILVCSRILHHCISPKQHPLIDVVHHSPTCRSSPWKMFMSHCIVCVCVLTHTENETPLADARHTSNVTALPYAVPSTGFSWVWVLREARGQCITGLGLLTKYWGSSAIECVCVCVCMRVRDENVWFCKFVSVQLIEFAKVL